MQYEGTEVPSLNLNNNDDDGDDDDGLLIHLVCDIHLRCPNYHTCWPRKWATDILTRHRLQGVTFWKSYVPKVYAAEVTVSHYP